MWEAMMNSPAPRDAIPAELCDVAVIGGGPAGSTAAILLAKRGFNVIALEKAHHPRFHIGESLLPMNLPLFERLGVLDKVRALGVFKPGADFEADNERGYNTYAFSRAIGKSPPHAYQVWRQDFDKMLFDHARECGADTREGHEVNNVEQSGPRETDSPCAPMRAAATPFRLVMWSTPAAAMHSLRRRRNCGGRTINIKAPPSSVITKGRHGALVKMQATSVSIASSTAGCG